MCRSRWAVWLRDERGGATVWGILWFILFVGICGLAVDITNGFRNRTMLQATADTAALAAAIDLPSKAAAVATAISYSDSNMPGDIYGGVLQTKNVEVGSWDPALRSFSPAAAVPDAVRVTLHQTAANANAVPVNFLRIVGLMEWDVNVQAIAQRFVPGCLNDGLIARGLVDISSNNGFVNRICIHGNKGVAMQNHNYFQPGVKVTMPDLDTNLKLPDGGMQSNPGLPQALGEEILDPRMVNHVDEIVADLLAKNADVLPSYIDAKQAVVIKDEKWNFSGTQAGFIYWIQCSANKNAGIPSNTVLRGVAIVSDCKISVGSGVFLSDVVLASRSGGNPGNGNGGNGASGGGGSGTSNANISFSANVTLGTPDNCATGGGVQIFSNASVQFSSTMTMNGVQVVAAGDVDLGARDMGINGISVQAGGNITLTSNNMFGLCSGGAPNLFTVPYYRLVL